jgi:hypothetical protein
VGLDVDLTLCLPQLQSGILKECRFEAQDALSHHIWLAPDVLLHVGLEALVALVQDEILEHADRRDIKVGGAVVDESLKLMLHLGREHDIGPDQHFEKDDAQAVPVLDMLSFGSLAPLSTHIVGIRVEDRGVVGLVRPDGRYVDYVNEVKLGGILVQEDCARLDGVEHDVLLLDADKALKELDCDAGGHLQHLGTVSDDLPQHDVLLRKLKLYLHVAPSEI